MPEFNDNNKSEQLRANLRKIVQALDVNTPSSKLNLDQALGPTAPNSTIKASYDKITLEKANQAKAQILEKLLLDLGATLADLLPSLTDNTTAWQTLPAIRDTRLMATISLLKVAIQDFIVDSQKINLIIDLYKSKPLLQDRLQNSQEFTTVLTKLCDNLCNILHVLDPEVLQQVFLLTDPHTQQLSQLLINQDKLGSLLIAFEKLSQRATEYCQNAASLTSTPTAIYSLLQSFQASASALANHPMLVNTVANKNMLK